jgi:hypothetical protein
VNAIEHRADDTHVFRLSAKPRHVRLCSRSAVPQELGVARDPRSLGVAVRQLVLAQPQRQRVLEASAASLAEGFHEFEPSNGIRWTDGDAAIPAELFAGMTRSAMLLVQLGAETCYVDHGPGAA